MLIAFHGKILDNGGYKRNSIYKSHVLNALAYIPRSYPTTFGLLVQCPHRLTGLRETYSSWWEQFQSYRKI
ncbi:hypothetical protein GBA52_008209 [Prunus armeniaca]|nr:hypothetical protein GBA52_008209 [Prunus armeniaca]